jgi:hypothetical protein
MSALAKCPVCLVDIHNSHAGWTTHYDGPRHVLALMGLTAEQAEAFIQVVYDAGVSYDAAMAAFRDALARPPDFYREAAEALKALANDRILATMVANPRD